MKLYERQNEKKYRHFILTMPLKCSKTSFSSLLRDIKPEVRCCVGLTLTV